MGHRRNEIHPQHPPAYSRFLLYNVPAYVESLSGPMLDTTPLLSGLRDGALPVTAGWVALIWYSFILVVCALGYFQMYDSPMPLSINCTNLRSQMETIPQPTAQIQTSERRRRTTRHRHSARKGPRATPLRLPRCNLQTGLPTRQTHHLSLCLDSR